jgi:hypothetical protein
MGKIIELTHDDVQNELAYALICETMEDSVQVHFGYPLRKENGLEESRFRKLTTKNRPQHNLVGGFFRNLRYNYKLQNKE